MRTVLIIIALAVAAYAIYWVVTNLGEQYDRRASAAAEYGKYAGKKGPTSDSEALGAVLGGTLDSAGNLLSFGIGGGNNK